MLDQVIAVPSAETAEAKEFRESLPYPVVATNLPGAYAMTEMPKGVDLRSAGSKALLRHGIPYRRPTASDRPALQATWAEVFQRETPLGLIVPQLRVHPGRTHRWKPRKAVAAGPEAATGNWAGAVVDSDATTGPWTSVTGHWTIPTVSAGTPSPAVANGWQCSSWVGIDGYTDATPSNDVLQTGIEQTVDGNGNTTCTAWFEWFVDGADLTGGVYSISQNLVTLGDTTPMSPSMASVGANLYLAWRGDGNDQMNVTVSYDGGQTFSSPPMVTADSSTNSPSLCEMDGNLYLAWKGDGNDNLNVARVQLDANGAPLGLINNVPLGDTSKSGPALCSLNGMLYLAWRGEGNDLICIMRSPDGQNWSNQHVSGVTTPVSPALGVCNGQLFLAWKGDGNDNLNVATVALDNSKAPVAVTDVNVLGVTSPHAPALAGLNGFLYLSFVGENGDELYVFVSEDEGVTFSVGHGSAQSSPSGPAMAVVNEQVMLSWRGEDNDQLNLSPVLSNFSTLPYVLMTTIDNFGVNPGDQVTASVTYSGTTSGMVQFSNNTSGQAFSLTLLPPPGANFNGKCVEWIMETPSFGSTLSTLPNFGAITFDQAFGCANRDQATANPAAGVSPNPEVVDSKNRTVTRTTTGTDTVTVSYQAPAS